MLNHTSNSTNATSNRVRLEALYEYEILDTLPEKDFDDITKIASEICQMPISLISLIDEKRQWFKSNRGMDGSETPIEFSFCAHAIINPSEVMVVPDSLKDNRFKDNPYVTGDPHIMFYAGVPLLNPNGISFGTLCVLDSKPNNLSESQIISLRALANQVVCQLELRKTVKQLRKAEIEKEKNHEIAMEEKRLRIEQFSFITSHELRHEFSKIQSIILLTKKSDYSQEELPSAIQHIGNAATSINSIIEKLNAKLNPTIDGNRNVKLNVHLSDMEEICLVEDDRLINLINSRIIKIVLPETPIKVFESVESGLLHIKTNSLTKRFIFLDLNFPVKSGWDFMDEYILMKIQNPIAILSSSIDPSDYQKAKTYKDVLAFYSKPLTTELLEILK